MPPGLPNRAAIFAVCLLSPMPIAQVSPVAAKHRRLQVRRERLGILDGRADERLVPAPHLDRQAGNERSAAITSADAAS